MIGNLVAGEVVRAEELAHFELDEVEQLRIVDHVDLVEGDDDVRHADLAGQQDVLARLRHRAVSSGDHEDRAVHLRGAGDHVLDVVSVARAVDVRVVALLGRVLDVRGGDGDAALALFRSLVDHVEGRERRRALRGQDLGDCRRQRGLAVVDVTDRADVHMRLTAIEFLFSHRENLLLVRSLAWTKVGLRCRSDSLCRSRRLGDHFFGHALRRRLVRRGTASCSWRGPATSSAPALRNRTSPTAARAP